MPAEKTAWHAVGALQSSLEYGDRLLGTRKVDLLGLRAQK